VSLRGRVHRLLGKFDRRVTLVESAAERIEGAVENILEIASELRAEFRATALELKTAVAEIGKTVNDDLLQAMADERERRAGLGREVMAQSSRLDTVERRIGRLEEAKGGHLGGAAE
jgi:predicted  nucleic acid-binding Zn-ribbon protein